MLNTDQFTATNKAQLDALVGLTSTAFDGVQQLATLNLQTVKSSLEDAAETTRAVLSVKDPKGLLALQAGALQPVAEKAAAYGRQVVEIVSNTKAEFEKVATEQAAGVQNSFLAAVDGLAKNAPEGAANGIALLKSSFAAANNAFDSLQKATKQATDVAEANYTAVADSVVKATKAKRA